MKNSPAKRSAEKSRSLARAFIDMGGFEIDPRLAELLLSVSPANSLVGGTLEPGKLQSDLVVDVGHVHPPSQR